MEAWSLNHWTSGEVPCNLNTEGPPRGSWLYGGSSPPGKPVPPKALSFQWDTARWIQEEMEHRCYQPQQGSFFLVSMEPVERDQVGLRSKRKLRSLIREGRGTGGALVRMLSHHPQAVGGAASGDLAREGWGSRRAGGRRRRRRRSCTAPAPAGSATCGASAHGPLPPLPSWIEGGVQRLCTRRES